MKDTTDETKGRKGEGKQIGLRKGRGKGGGVGKEEGRQNKQK